MQKMIGSLSVLSLTLRALWIAFAVVLLVLSLYLYDGQPNSDADELLVVGMLALCAPIGAAVATAIGVLLALAGVFFNFKMGTSYWSMVVEWTVLAAAGYWQWFIVLPRLLAKGNGSAWLVVQRISSFWKR